MSSGSSSKEDKEDKNIVDFGSPFPEGIKKTTYKYILNVPGEYSIYLDTSGYHWYIMVHFNVEGGEFPYVSLEITTDEAFGSDLIPTMRVLDEINTDKEVDLNPLGAAVDRVRKAAGTVVGGIALGLVAGPAVAMLKMSGTKLEKVGTLTTTINKLCAIAEATRVGMGKYNFLANNCQHFCNNVLKKLGLPTKPTTVGPTTTPVEGTFDSIDRNFKS